MSAAAIVLVVFVSASDARDPAMESMVKAARVALGPSANVIVREPARGMSDDDAVEIGKSLHANAVAEIAWSDPKRLHVTVHVHLEGATRWIDRDIAFVTADAPSERGRAVGFTIASMMPEREEEPPPAPPPPPPPAPTVVAPPPAPPLPTDVRVPEAPRVWRGTIDVAGQGTFGIGGYGGGLGAALGVRVNLGSGFALRFGGGARGGEVAPAQASSLFVFGAAGLAWGGAPSASLPLVLGVRADLLLTWLQLSHLSTDDPTPQRQSRWIGGADSLFEGAVYFSQSAGLFAALGAEYAFGSTTVIVAQKQVAVVPIVRGAGEVGLRARF